MTVTMRPFTVSGVVSSGESVPTEAPIIAPAIPPRSPVITNVAALTRVTRMPQSSAATGCCETARVASPSRVLKSRARSAAMQTTLTANTSSRSPRSVTSPAWNITSSNSAG